MWYVGRAYAGGLGGLQQSYKIAERNYLHAAEKGYAPAMNALGDLLDSGKAGPKDHAAAVEWYRHSAENGNEAAQDWLNKNAK